MYTEKIESATAAGSRCEIDDRDVVEAFGSRCSAADRSWHPLNEARNLREMAQRSVVKYIPGSSSGVEATRADRAKV